MSQNSYFLCQKNLKLTLHSLHHKNMLNTRLTKCDRAQCDRLQNTSMWSRICWKCDFFLAIFHHRTLLNVNPLILHKSQDQLSFRLVLIRQHQTLITSLFSVIILWTSKWNILQWWAGRLLKSRKINFHSKSQKKNENTHGAAFNLF